MCLEFLWRHKEEDHGLQPPPRNQHTEYPIRGESPSKPRSERSGNDSDTNSGRHDSPLKLHPEPNNGNKIQVTKPKAENPKNSSMVFNGEKDLKAPVHPRPLAPHQVTNNTVSAAPVPQPNPRISAQRNGHMRKDEDQEEEEDDDDDDDDEEEEEEAKAKAGQTKNRRY